MDEYKTIIFCWETFKKNYPKWRNGQALFNAIDAVSRVMSNKIRGTEIDPFYLDENIDKCLEFIKGEKDGRNNNL